MFQFMINKSYYNLAIRYFSIYQDSVAIRVLTYPRTFVLNAWTKQSVKAALIMFLWTVTDISPLVLGEIYIFTA